MHSVELRYSPSVQRVLEAVLIITFILADYLASGWVFIAVSAAAIICIVLPAIRTLRSLPLLERKTYLNAWIKTERVQKTVVLLFWMSTVRILLHLIVGSNLTSSFYHHQGILPLVSNGFRLEKQQFMPLGIFVYPAACFISILLRSRLKATKQDPDLTEQRQKWSAVNHVLLMGSSVASILSFTLHPGGPGRMLANWLVASGHDANLFAPRVDYPGLSGPKDTHNTHHLFQADPSGDLSFMQTFDNFVLIAVSVILFLILLKPILRLNAFLSSFCWRVVSPMSMQNMIEAFLETLRLPSRFLTFNEAHPFANNAARTLLWIVACYCSLFWLFGFCGGPLGIAIQNWMIASAVDAGLGTSINTPQWLFESRFRIFVGAVVALYSTAPIAVTACVFLPHRTARNIVLNCDGIVFAQGPYLSLRGRQFRLWSDLKSLSVKVRPRKNEMKAKFSLSFRSGGQISFNSSQLTSQDLKVLLDSIDQYAAACAVDPEVYTVCRTLMDMNPDTVASDGITDSAIETIAVDEFKSTIFVPFSTGEFLPTTDTRIIKLLSSKPLCAVYLARSNDGRLVTVKQFYLADQSVETRALEKILVREYELLSTLDHPDIAKVLNSFTFEKSTYLVIEHRLGSDMRAIVNENGPRSESLTVTWAKQLCQIMIYLHSRDPIILHRDLTPDNVIVGEDGNLRLIDFGAAREFLDGITGTMLGKHCYVSPEQLRGEATIKSDIYSFGSSLYYLLTARDPIALSQSSPANYSDCSSELNQLIRDCTEFEEHDRPRSFEEILKRLQALDSGFLLKFSAVKEKVTA
ncbi:MAG: serine/threonine-protein kinase [Candidatus Melainabacteria bacterium]|nr:serine/threonine-protein kinase [Candidatus Melainabacteria bacterium]